MLLMYPSVVMSVLKKKIEMVRIVKLSLHNETLQNNWWHPDGYIDLSCTVYEKNCEVAADANALHQHYRITSDGLAQLFITK